MEKNDDVNNQKAKEKSIAKTNSKVHKKLTKAITTIVSHEKKDTVDIFSKNDSSNSFFVYHFGNGDEEDHQMIEDYLVKNKIHFKLIRIFPGISYAFVEIENDYLASFKKSALNIYMKDKEINVYYYLDSRKGDEVKEDKIRPLFFMPTSHKLEETNLFKNSTLPNAKFSLSENYSVPGVVIIDDFISEDEEKELIFQIEANKWHKLSNRLVQHYGYEFIYGKNCVDKNKKIGELPSFTNIITSRIEKELGKFTVNTQKSSQFNCEFYDYDCKDSKEEAFINKYGNFDQLTINKYSPGDGIPPHVDSHAPFYDIYCSLSLLSGTVMTFSHKDYESRHVFLKPRSAIFFSNEVRYDWEHSIGLRKIDLVENTVKTRSNRISLTFRRIRSNDNCKCKFTDKCDTYKLNSGVNNAFVISKEEAESEEPTDIEKKHVYAVYEKIAPHFSNTRYKPWPKVVNFLETLEKYSFVGDIGCGNGKYLSVVNDIVTLGTDRSFNLSKIALEKNPKSNVFTSDSLTLPIKTGLLDAAISIAVIHHFSNDKLRIRAIKEIQRCVKINGRFLIYVWALEQEDGKFKDQDNLVPWHLQNNYKENEFSSKDESTTGVEIKEKNSVVYHRYYHVFKKDELEKLISEVEGVEILESYYDHENWCCICLNREVK